jgi:hypothetical protein
VTNEGSDPQPSDTLFALWVRRRNLIADGEAIVARNSRLLPAPREGAPATLKIAEIAAAELARA